MYAIKSIEEDVLFIPEIIVKFYIRLKVESTARLKII